MIKSLRILCAMHQLVMALKPGMVDRSPLRERTLRAMPLPLISRKPEVADRLRRPGHLAAVID